MTWQRTQQKVAFCFWAIGELHRTLKSHVRDWETKHPGTVAALCPVVDILSLDSAGERQLGRRERHSDLWGKDKVEWAGRRKRKQTSERCCWDQLWSHGGNSGCCWGPFGGQYQTGTVDALDGPKWKNLRGWSAAERNEDIGTKQNPFTLAQKNQCHLQMSVFFLHSP